MPGLPPNGVLRVLNTKKYILEMEIYSLMEHNPSGGYRCAVCHVVMTTKRNMFYHVESKHLKSTEGYTCELCLKKCSTMKALHIHNHRYHNLNNTQRLNVFQ